jgi:hypothetical protein
MERITHQHRENSAPAHGRNNPVRPLGSGARIFDSIVSCSLWAPRVIGRHLITVEDCMAPAGQADFMRSLVEARNFEEYSRFGPFELNLLPGFDSVIENVVYRTYSGC